MSSLLLVDSGATKTDWVWLVNGKKKKSIKSSGINPLMLSEEQILNLLQEEVKWDAQKNVIDQIHFYGAGVAYKPQKDMLKKLLTKHFGGKKIFVESDMLAAARALCGVEQGVVCILGTGSNSCFYNGKSIKSKLPSLGYLAGDEGSGNFIGKKVFQYYAYNIFDEELRLAFEQRYGNDLPNMIKTLYSHNFPNRYLASFVPVLADFRGHYMVENIIEDSFASFFHAHILKYRESWKTPVSFIGSIAYEFRDVLKNLCSQCEIELGTIAKSPMEGLIQYHKTVDF